MADSSPLTFLRSADSGCLGDLHRTVRVVEEGQGAAAGGTSQPRHAACVARLQQRPQDDSQSCAARSLRGVCPHLSHVSCVIFLVSCVFLQGTQGEPS